MVDCRHNGITVFMERGWEDRRMWACADCKLRFYPACLICGVGHRGEVHVEDEDTARLRKIEEAARDISRRTYVDDGVVAHVPFDELYALRQALYGSDEEIIAALDALDGSE